MSQPDAEDAVDAVDAVDAEDAEDAEDDALGRGVDGESAAEGPSAGPGGTPPAGDAYDWYRRGSALLADGNAAAAAELLAWAVVAEPEAASVRETYARALFDAGRFADAEQQFRSLVYLVPDDDYARFGLGLALWRLRLFPQAADQLAMAAVMRPDRTEYASALRQVRATLAAREEAGLDPVGSPEEAAAFGGRFGLGGEPAREGGADAAEDGSGATGARTADDGAPDA